MDKFVDHMSTLLASQYGSSVNLSISEIYYQDTDLAYNLRESTIISKESICIWEIYLKNIFP